MGIKRLNNFLESNSALEYYDNMDDFTRSFKNDEYKIFNTKGKKFVVGIDFLLYAYKYKYSSDNFLLCFLNQILNFLENKIIPIYIIDGLAPDEKKNEVNNRNLKKEKIEQKIKELENENMNDMKVSEKIEKLKKMTIKILPEEIKLFIEMLKIMNIPFLRAQNEADLLITKLYKSKVINACLSEDMDLLAFGCGNVFKFKSSNIVKYNLENILEKLNLCYDEFVELCILFGCDYLKQNLKSTPQEIYNLYKNSDNINDFIKNDGYLEKFYNVKKIFLNSDEGKKYYNINIKIKEIPIDKLILFIKVNCNIKVYDFKNIKNQINYINKLVKQINI